MHPNATDGTVKSEIMSNQHLADELPQPITQRKELSFLKGNLLEAEVAVMQLVNKYSKGN